MARKATDVQVAKFDAQNPTNDAQSPQNDPELLPVAENTRYSAIDVSNITLGEGDILASFDVRIGSVLVRSVRLRQGRKDTTHINFPSYRDKRTGRWLPYIQITSPALHAAVEQAIHRAVSEVLP